MKKYQELTIAILYLQQDVVTASGMDESNNGYDDIIGDFS